MIRFEVAVAAPLHNTLSYLHDLDTVGLGAGISAESYIGRRVLVPLGRRKITGYILGPQPDEEVDFVLKKIDDILDDAPLFHPNIVPFFRWVATYYHFPIGEVINTALPAGLKKTSRTIIGLCSTSQDVTWPYDDIPQPDWFADLQQNGRLSHAVSKKIGKVSSQKKALKRLVDDQIIEISRVLNTETVKKKSEKCYTTALQLEFPCDLTEINRSSLTEFSQQIEQKCQRELKFSEVKALYYHTKLASQTDNPVAHRDLLKAYKGAAGPLKELSRLGLINTISKRVYRNPFGEVLSYHPAPKTLTEEQSHALVRIGKSLEASAYETFLLHGVTGSGKTEVYLQAAEYCIKKGRDVLVLVPEIALATQLESHFVSRFGSLVALLHSGLSKGEKYDQWSLVASGVAKVVIGARSAVFAPLKNLGLIVVDEEHDGGFKQHDSLKYNARDLAVLRGRFDDAVVILGSATPSITSYYHSTTRKYTLLTMEKRVGSSTLPQVGVIDLKQEGQVKKKSIFNSQFSHQLQQNLTQGEQSLILLNRRGFSASYLCQECGTSVQCQHCNVTLTYHKRKENLVCHYCGFTLSSRIVCVNCRSDKLVPFGFGTERVEEELQQKFPEARISRLDSDTAGDRKKIMQILKEMHNHDIDILIGTQMIAKGHHFPLVTFVGVVWADSGLNMPDFRAAERTFQLLSQVTGRAGRGTKKGRVLIQTMRPNHYAITLSQTHQYRKFYEREIAIRQRPAFPPFVRLVCLRISGDVEYDVKKTAQGVVAACRSICQAREMAIEIFGPASSPIEKLQDLYRWQVLLKSAETAHLHSLCGFIRENMKGIVVGTSKISLDVDPENMM